MPNKKIYINSLLELIIFPLSYNNFMFLSIFHGAKAISLAVFKLTNVLITVFVSKFAFAICSFTGELALKSHSIRCNHDPPSMSIALDKPTLISDWILPCVFSLSIWFTITIFAFIDITIGKCLLGFAMLQVVFEGTFIFLTIGTDMDPIAFDFAMSPVTRIAVPFGGFPDPGAMPESIPPIALISFPIFPGKDALAVAFAVLESACIVSLGSYLISLHNVVLGPLAFQSEARTYEDANAFSQTILHWTKVYVLALV